MKSSRANKSTSRVPVRRDELGTRIDEVSRLIGTRKEAARAGRVSLPTFQRYLSGESRPDADFLIALSTAAGVSFEWLATGKGVPPRRAGLNEASAKYLGSLPVDDSGADQELLRISLEAVEHFLARLGETATPQEKAVRVLEIYKIARKIVGPENAPATLAELLRILKLLTGDKDPASNAG